jgi:excinuclease ABC subunit B
MEAAVAVGEEVNRDLFLRRLVDIQYSRNDVSPARGDFRAAGDTVDVFPSYRDEQVRIEFWGDTVDRITRRDPLTGKVEEDLDRIIIFPAKHFVMPYENIKRAEVTIQAELEERVRWFEERNRLIEAQRIYQRTMYDLEMLREIGYCSGIENYSRHLAGLPPGSRPYTLIDYFPDDFLVVIDESHVSIPQVRAMYQADRNRKLVLVEHGFRLPSALDNRPLAFDEFESLIGQVMFVSATPGPYELERTEPIEQVVRPTGLLDPEVEVRPLEGQIDDLIEEVRKRAELGERVLVTTLTKRTAEDLSDYLRDIGLRVRYIHSELDAIERVEVIRSLRQGDFDCLVGINLLREGLDLPEVSLVAILDADKEGFLRSERSLIQTAGRAARHLNGRVILYADRMTDSIRKMLALTHERRQRQEAYNREHGIEPRSVKRAVQASLQIYRQADEVVSAVIREEGGDYDVQEAIRQLEKEMGEAAEALEFERAAMLRDQIHALRDDGDEKGGNTGGGARGRGPAGRKRGRA